jgi:glycosyltransferase involved in cell wall biosynthesis
MQSVSKHKQPDLTVFSIVIPTYNRPSQLETCLKACSRLDYVRGRFEVIVVDDGGTSPLDELVAQFRDTLDLRLLRQKNSGPAAARNRGASVAKGQFLVFTDDDCIPEPNWLRALEAQFSLTPNYAVGGQTLNFLTDNCYSITSGLLISYLTAYYNAGEARFFTSNNLAFPAEQFRTLGGFDVTFPRAAAEDREICDRWLHRGYRVIDLPDAVVFHAHHLTFGSFVRQHFYYGEGAFCFHEIRARRGRQPIRLEPASFYLKMFQYPFRSTQGAKPAFLAVLLLVSQVAHTLGFFRSFIKEKIFKRRQRLSCR